MFTQNSGRQNNDMFKQNLGWKYKYNDRDGSYEVPIGSIERGFKPPSSVPLPKGYNDTNDSVEQHNCGIATFGVTISDHTHSVASILGDPQLSYEQV